MEFGRSPVHAGATSRPVVVIDNGTGFTKMGFSGNIEPSFIFPTAIAPAATKTTSGAGLNDMDVLIGEEVVAAAVGGSRGVVYPVRQGQVRKTRERGRTRYTM